MGKVITYTNHATAAIQERELQFEWVERTVCNPQWTEPDPLDSKIVRYFCSIPERGGRYLRVALVETNSEYRIVSTFLDRRARPK